MCGGKDRFRFDDKGGRGTWICSRCGAGDGIELVKRLLNVEFKEAARLIEQQIGAAPVIRHGIDRRQTDERRSDRKWSPCGSGRGRSRSTIMPAATSMTAPDCHDVPVLPALFARRALCGGRLAGRPGIR